MYKDAFLDLLTSYDPNEVNEYIKSKGKQPKEMRPLFYFTEDEETNNNDNLKEDKENGKSN